MKKFVALSTVHLRLLLKKILKTKHFQVGAIDELKYFDFPITAIINIQPSNLEGLHWIALFFNKQNNTIEVFDTFGLNYYGKYIEEFAKKHSLHIVSNNNVYQTNTSLLCGYFSIYFLKQRLNGVSFKDFLTLFNASNLKQNEVMIRKYFSKIKYPIISYNNLRNRKFCNIRQSDFASVCIQRNKKFEKLYICLRKF